MRVRLAATTAPCEGRGFDGKSCAGCLRTGGRNKAADVIGGPLIGQLMPLIRDDGRWVIAGAVAGAVVDFDLRWLHLHNLSLIGSSMHTRDHFTALVDAARAGAVQSVIAAQYALDDLAAAQDQFGCSQHVGKIVIAIDSEAFRA